MHAGTVYCMKTQKPKHADPRGINTRLHSHTSVIYGTQLFQIPICFSTHTDRLNEILVCLQGTHFEKYMSE